MKEERKEERKEDIQAAVNLIETSESIVFFGGAGVSTESGIPDFRSANGLYNQKELYAPETILSHRFFIKNKEIFFRFYWEHMVFQKAKPNCTHEVLAKLEKKGRIKAVITQNIDGLHQMAGSKQVKELHGSVHRNYCMLCGRFYSLDTLLDKRENFLMQEGADKTYIPTCECSGYIKPEVVLYEEALDQDTVREAITAIEQADTLIVGGTSLSVYPAAGFIQSYKGKHLLLINKTPTSFDDSANMALHCGLGEVFSQVNVDKL